MRGLYLILFIILLSSAAAKSQSRISSFPDTDAGNVHFYPNPAVSYITFDFQKKFDKGYSLQVFNFLGKKVTEFSAADQKTIVNLSDFFRGIYIFQLKDPSGRIVESGKFQVSK